MLIYFCSTPPSTHPRSKRIKAPTLAHLPFYSKAHFPAQRKRPYRAQERRGLQSPARVHLCYDGAAAARTHGRTQQGRRRCGGGAPPRPRAAFAYGARERASPGGKRRDVGRAAQKSDNARAGPGGWASESVAGHKLVLSGEESDCVRRGTGARGG